MIGDDLLHQVFARVSSDPAEIWLVDLRLARPAVFGVFARAWAKNGVLARDLTAALDEPPLALVDRMIATGAPVVVLARGPEPIARQLDPAGRQLIEVLWRSLPHVPEVIVCDAAGEPVAGNGTRNPPGALAIAPADLTVTGMRRFEFPAVSLPARLTIEMPSTEDPDGCLIVVEGRCSQPLPSASRFSLRGPDRTVLVIDCVPDFAGDDQWLVTVEGPAGGVAQRARRLPPAPPPPPLRRLIVLFDRTCPDEDRWSQAYALMFGRETARDDLMAMDTGQAADPRDINAAVRHALGQALAEALDPAVTIEAYWFADVPGDGLSAPPGVVTSPVGCGQAGQIPASEAADLFADLTYYPGLDIWDALDEALAAAVAERRSRDRTALLVVGNSPPHLPTRASSPLHRIRKRLGYPTAFRRWADSWHENLHACWERRIPTGYLFLTHRRHAPAEQREFEMFRSTQTEVALALEDCGLDVERTPATEAGLHRGVSRLLKRLAATDARSRVEVIADDAP